MDNTRLDNSILASSTQSAKAMASAEKRSESKESGKDELFKLNQLWYKMPPSLSLVSKRCLTKGYFQQSSYPNASGKVLQCIVNTGEFYVNPRTSYLVIRCGINRAAVTGLPPTKSAHALLGQGDITSIFQETYFTAASGTEVCREQEKHLCNAVIGRQMLSQDYLDTQGELSGWPGDTLRKCFDLKGWGGDLNGKTDDTAPQKAGEYFPLRNTSYSSLRPDDRKTPETVKYGTTTGAVDVSYDPANVTQGPTEPLTFIVPVHRLWACFNPYMSVLFPAPALAGATLTLRVADLTRVLIATGYDLGVGGTALAEAFVNSFNIDEIFFLWDSFQLNDSVLKRLNDISQGTEGLSVMFDAWDHASTAASSTVVEAQISQAKSRIIRSVCILRDQGETVNIWANKLASEAAIKRTSGLINTWDSKNFFPVVSTYQAQLGSLYFPQQPLQSPEECLMNAYYVFCKCTMDESDSSSLSKDDFLGATGINHFDEGKIVNPNTGEWDVTAAERLVPLPANQPPWSMNWGLATYGFIAERSQLLQLTGLPISNARLLRHKFQFNYMPESGQPRQIDTFTQYTRVMKVFYGGRVVMRE